MLGDLCAFVVSRVGLHEIQYAIEVVMPPRGDALAVSNAPRRHQEPFGPRTSDVAVELIVCESRGVPSSIVSTRACVEPCVADKEKIDHGTGTEGSGSAVIVVGRHSEPHCDGRGPISKRKCAPDWICSHVITGIASGLPSIVAL